VLLQARTLVRPLGLCPATFADVEDFASHRAGRVGDDLLDGHFRFATRAHNCRPIGLAHNTPQTTLTMGSAGRQFNNKN